MARSGALETDGVILSELPNGRWRVELPNGHRLVVRRGRQAAVHHVVPGQNVRVHFSPCDFSHGYLVK